MSASAAPRASLLPPAPAPGPVYGGAYDCLVCGVSVRRTPAPALRCARCPCRPFHRACAPPGSPGARACPQCAQASVVPFAGALTRPAAGPGGRVVLAEARIAGEQGGALGGAAAGGQARSGHGQPQGEARRDVPAGPGSKRARERPAGGEGEEEEAAGEASEERGRQRQRGSGGATRRVEKKCEHNRRRSICKDCGGTSICQHNRQRNTCKDCGGASICQHNRQRSTCKDCGGASICQHNRERRYCKDCGGSGICAHYLIRRSCKECKRRRAELAAANAQP